MAEKSKIDPMDELLRIAYLESNNLSSASEAEEPLYYLKNLTKGTRMSMYKKNLLLEKLLKQTAESFSFGQLLLTRIQKSGFSMESLSERVKLSVERIRALSEDEIITNLVPVMILKNLLNMLHISVAEAQQAIWKTYDIILQKEIETQAGESLQVYFRRSYDSRHKGSGLQGENDSISLYKNKEALGRYLDRLEELMENE